MRQILSGCALTQVLWLRCLRLLFLTFWSLVLVLHIRNPPPSPFSLAAGRPGRGPQAVARETLGAGLANGIYDEPESPNEGACSRHMMRGVFTIYDEPRSPHEATCLGYMMSLNRPTGEGVCVYDI